jgi:YesN/AraC family two-component response regulator
MTLLKLSESAEILYHWCGKFESPSPEWMHLTRNLTDFELILVTNGTLFIADSTRRHMVKTGEYLIMPPDKYQHGYRQSKCTFYWLHFTTTDNTFELLRETPADCKNPSVCMPVQSSIAFSDRIVVLMKQLQDSDKRYHNPQLNNALTTAIIQELYSQGTVYKKQHEHEKTTQIYNDITDYIGYHACENLRVSEIADYFGYNEKYLSTFFKKRTGISLKQFMLQTKMDVAMAELSDTNHSISQIAYNVGFNDTHNFTNSFKKITGLTPSAYRESYTKRALFHE